MPSERIQRRIDALLDGADSAAAERDWRAVGEAARAVLAIDGENEDARAFLAMAEANGASSSTGEPPGVSPDPSPGPPLTPPAVPESFAGGRYRLAKFLGEGGKKRVFLAHDALLDRDVAFSLIKTDGLDEIGRERIMREARAM